MAENGLQTVSMVDNVVSNTVVGQYIKMLCLFLTSPPDFPLYRVERGVLNPTLTVSEAINISLRSLTVSLSFTLSFKASVSLFFFTFFYSTVLSCLHKTHNCVKHLHG